MRRIFLLLALFGTLTAHEFGPWLPPLWEFQGRTTYHYDKEEKVQSPLGTFEAPSRDHSLGLNLGLTFWPNWNLYTEFVFTRTTEIPFSYEAASVTLRTQWLDDIAGDPLSLTTGLIFSFPGDRYLRDFSFPYHGNVNGELYVALGKEFACGEEWWMRMWAQGGFGIANRGNGWARTLTALEFNPGPFEFGALVEGLFGFGPNDILPDAPFEGYASIGHQTVDLIGFLGFPVGCLGTFSLLGWTNMYARNFVEHAWGAGATIHIPFGL